ncbi:molybdopterin-dependent oxidoreductase [Saccharomonospora sp. NPDC006951]
MRSDKTTWSTTTSHWGAYRVRAAGDTVEVAAHPLDKAPSPLLGNVAAGSRHPTRIAAPAVRRGWLDHGSGPSTRRGRDDFVEVTWDTALDLLAEQLEATRKTHGNSAIFGGSYGWASAGRFHHAQSQLHRFLNVIGGYTSSRNTYSTGSSSVLLPHLVGDADTLLRNADTWPTIAEHTDLLVAFGGLPAKNVSVTPGGVTEHSTSAALRELGDAGVEVVSISPLADDVPGSAGARWLPIAPATDVALMLGLAHTLLTEGLHDPAFLERYCVGFDDVADYLLGRRDGTRKNAEWAAGFCDIPAADIRALARKMAASRTLITVSWSLQRIEHGEQPVWAGLTLAAMLGQIGLPGGGFGHGYGSMGDVGETGPALQLPFLPRGHNAVRSFIPVARIADMLLNPGGHFDYNGGTYHYPDIRLVYWAGGNPFHHHQDLNRLRLAFGKPDTVVVHEPHWTATARHADIVLPVTTTLEREDIGAGRRDTHLFAMPRVLEPYGRARDDYRILADVADRLGAGDDFTEGRTAAQWLEHLYDGWSEKLRRDGHDLPSFASFWERGSLRLPAGQLHPTPLARFRADPDGNGLATPSGRIELVSATIAGFGYPACPGQATWFAPEPDASHPLHLIANQPRTRLHGQGDVGEASQNSKISGREPITMHPRDAAARGVGEGDVVRVFNSRGACLAGVVLSDRVRPGVVVLATGAWFDPVDYSDSDGAGPALCAHGNPNVLTADIPTSPLAQGCAGQHADVEIESYPHPLPTPRNLVPPAIEAASPRELNTKHLPD